MARNMIVVLLLAGLLPVPAGAACSVEAKATVPLDVAGRLADVVEVYRKIPSGRLVVLVLPRLRNSHRSDTEMHGHSTQGAASQHLQQRPARPGSVHN